MTDGDSAIDLAVDATFQLDLFVRTAWHGLDFAAHSTRVVKTLADYRNQTRQDASPPHPTPEELERAAKLEAFAAEQLPYFPFLHSLATFRLWAILEAGVEDWLRELLAIHPEMWERPRFAQLEGALVPFGLAAPHQQAEILFDGLKERLAAQLKIGVGRFETLLDACGIGGGVCDVVRRIILELVEVRNIVAHRNGKADERFLQQCPWFAGANDQTILVTQLHFQRYVTAVHWYLVELSRRYLALNPASEVDAPKRLADKRDLLDFLEAKLQQMEQSLSEHGTT